MGAVTLVVLVGTSAGAIVAAMLARRPEWHWRAVAQALVALVVAAAPSAFLGLTSLGVHESWTGRRELLDSDWILFGCTFSAVWALALIALRVGRSRPTERLIPLVFAGLLMAFGLAQVYGWELRDSNAYVSAAALPELRETLGQTTDIPSEVDFEAATGQTAVVTNDTWLEAFNAAADRSPEIRRVDPTDLTRRQLAATGLGMLAAAGVWLASLLDWRRWSRGFARYDIVVTGAFCIIVLAGVPSSLGTQLPALVQIGGLSVTVFELVKLLAISSFAFSLASRAAGHTSGRWAFAASIGAVALLTLVDLGAGLTIAAIGLTMTTITMQRRTARIVFAAVVALPLLAPVAVGAMGAHLPGAASTRINDWADPWASHDTATIDHLVATSAADVQFAVSQRARPVDWADAIALIDQELSYRITAGTDEATRPVVPLDTTDELLLVEAEQAWSELGGYQAGEPASRHRVTGRVVDYLHGMRAAVDGSAPSAGQDGFQLQRSLFALRHGGLTGTGLGQGRPEAIPTVTEDLALVAWAESTGLVGLLLASALVLALTDFAIRQIHRSALLPALLLLGLGSQFAIQGLVNAGGLIGALPFTGVPFPFISRSGTAAVGSGLSIGALITVLDRHRSRTFFSGRSRSAPQVLGLGAGFVVIGASFAMLMVTGSRLLTPGPLLSSLDTVAAEHLLVPDQWAAANPRTIRGPIVAGSGERLVENAQLAAGRSAPDVTLATSLGHSLRQLDLAFDAELTESISGQLVGASLVTTIDAPIQLAADAAFDTGVAQLTAARAEAANTGDVRGAVVLLDARTGAVLAMVSRPTFGLDELVDPAIWATAEGLDRRGGFDSRFLNRAFQGLYPPASTFKTVTAAAALQHDLHAVGDADFVYIDGPTGPQQPNGYDHVKAWHQLPLTDGPPVTDGNHPEVEEWSFDIAESFAYSCNVAFAEMGLELGATRLVETARQLGFETPVSIAGLGTSISTLDRDSDLPAESRSLAQTSDALTRTSFGQGNVLATPMSMALVAAAVANDGIIMAPRLVSGFRKQSGEWLRQYDPEVLIDSGLDDDTITDLQQLFRGVVDFGTGTKAAVNVANADPAVGGKTGTAEWGDDGGVPHAWFIGAFPAHEPRLAVAVIVEEGGSGGGAAAQVASALLGSDAVANYLSDASAAP